MQCQINASSALDNNTEPYSRGPESVCLPVCIEPQGRRRAGRGSLLTVGTQSQDSDWRLATLTRSLQAPNKATGSARTLTRALQLSRRSRKEHSTIGVCQTPYTSHPKMCVVSRKYPKITRWCRQHYAHVPIPYPIHVQYYAHNPPPPNYDNNTYTPAPRSHPLDDGCTFFTIA